MRRSRLDDITGLGHARKKELLAHFRSIDYIREASVTQICEVPGIGPRLAQQIYDYFHPFSGSHTQEEASQKNGNPIEPDSGTGVS